MNDTANKQQEEKKSRNPWTSAFARVTESILAKYKDKVQIISEYELFKQPMRIDLVIIKLKKGVVINNSVMRFFKTHNIVEFKGPKDKLSIEAFDKTMSYFYAYLSKERSNRKPNVFFNDVTLTLVSVKKPVETLKILETERNYKIASTATSGIYRIVGDCVPAIQLVVTSELPRDGKDESFWLRVLRNNIPLAEGIEFVNRAKNKSGDDPVWEGIRLMLNTNLHVLTEVKKMRTSPKAKKILNEWAIETGKADEWMREGMRKGMREGMREGMRKGVREGAQEVFAYLRKGHSLAEAEKKFAYSR